MWCIAEFDKECIERREYVLDVYEKPVPLVNGVRERISVKPGSPEKVDYEYERDGSVNVFVAVEPKASTYFTEVTERMAGFELMLKSAD